VRFERYNPNSNTWYAFQVNPSSCGLAIWISDITEMKRIQKQAEHSVAMLDALMEDVPEGSTIASVLVQREAEGKSLAEGKDSALRAGIFKA
jgi:hypothetical protein